MAEEFPHLYPCGAGSIFHVCLFVCLFVCCTTLYTTLIWGTIFPNNTNAVCNTHGWAPCFCGKEIVCRELQACPNFYPKAEVEPTSTGKPVPVRKHIITPKLV